MADLDLRVDYQDDILDSSVNTKRKYNIIENADGTKSLEDVSVYTQNGDSFGAVDINKTNQAVLDLNQSLDNVETRINGYGTSLDFTSIISFFNGADVGFSHVLLSSSNPFGIAYGSALIFRRSATDGIILVMSYYSDRESIYKYSILNGAVVGKHKFTGTAFT